MKTEYVKYGLILIFAIYLVSVLERVLNQDSAPSEILIEHATERARMQTKIDLLENKIHGYEIELLKIRTDVDDYSNDEIDSVWATIFD
jgi:hypothetical protein